MEINLERIAELAKLQLTANELVAMEKDFKAILSVADELPNLNNEEDKSNALHLNELREDDAIVGLSREELLDQSPASVNGCIAVPKIMES